MLAKYKKNPPKVAAMEIHWLLILVWRYFFLKRVGKENLREWQAGLVWLVDPLNPDPPLTDCSSHTDLLPTVPHFSVYIPHCRPLAQKISRFLQLQLLRYEKCFCDVKEVTSFEEWLLDFSKLLICFKQSTGWSIVPLALFLSLFFFKQGENQKTILRSVWFQGIFAMQRYCSEVNVHHFV